jgi:S-adenosylmethionine hydrolase
MLITLTTDFGPGDSFVGTMKGVIAGIAPRAHVVDLSHNIPAHDVLAGALILRHSERYFPRGTIHVVVVDPGVGSARRPILIRGAESYFIGPDNGVLSLATAALEPAEVIELANPAYQLRPSSMTFHGRDIFAPAAAHLALGVAPHSFGPRLDRFCQLALPRVVRQGNVLEAEIIYIDAFGNLFTNISDRDLPAPPALGLQIVMGAVQIDGLSAHYAAAAVGQYVALINSWGLLEIAVNQGDARRGSGAKVGDKIGVFFAN